MFRAALLAAVLTALAGCGSSLPPPPPTVQWAGTVTLDGQPLKAGLIVFAPLEVVPGGGPASAPIADGKYAAAVPKGKVRVTISAGAAAGSAGSSDARTAGGPAIPAKYRDGIPADATADDPARNFELKSR